MVAGSQRGDLICRYGRGEAPLALLSALMRPSFSFVVLFFFAAESGIDRDWPTMEHTRLRPNVKKTLHPFG